jgi:hypothetical protein
MFWQNKTAKTTIVSNANTTVQSSETLKQTAKKETDIITSTLQNIGAGLSITWSWLQMQHNKIMSGSIINPGSGARISPPVIIRAGGGTSTVSKPGTTGKHSPSPIGINISGKKAAVGSSFMATKPTLLQVGEAGAEHVSVTPQAARHGRGSGDTYIYQMVTVQGNVWALRDLQAELDDARKQALRSRNIGV